MMLIKLKVKKCFWYYPDQNKQNMFEHMSFQIVKLHFFHKYAQVLRNKVWKTYVLVFLKYTSWTNECKYHKPGQRPYPGCPVHFPELMCDPQLPSELILPLFRNLFYKWPTIKIWFKTMHRTKQVTNMLACSYK